MLRRVTVPRPFLILRPLLWSTHLVMPSKRAASSKRKEISESDSEDASNSTKSTKKAKLDDAAASNSQLAASSAQPTNKVLPVVISFPAKHAGSVRIATWNVCGLATSQKKVLVCSSALEYKGTKYVYVGSPSQGFKVYIEAEDPDILILTETKVRFVVLFISFLHAINCYRSIMNLWTLPSRIGFHIAIGPSRKKKVTVSGLFSISGQLPITVISWYCYP
jgi:hypothetical protein